MVYSKTHLNPEELTVVVCIHWMVVGMTYPAVCDDIPNDGLGKPGQASHECCNMCLKINQVVLEMS